MLNFILIEIKNRSHLIILDVLVAKVDICLNAHTKLVKFFHDVVIFDLDQLVLAISLFLKNNRFQSANYKVLWIVSYNLVCLFFWKLYGGKIVFRPLLVSLNIEPLFILFYRELNLA